LLTVGRTRNDDHPEGGDPVRPVDLTSAVAEQQISDRMEQARKARLAAIARCCRPRTWKKAITRAVAAARSAAHRSALQQPGVCCG
jgi:hypothetical protein